MISYQLGLVREVERRDASERVSKRDRERLESDSYHADETRNVRVCDAIGAALVADVSAEHGAGGVQEADDRTRYWTRARAISDSTAYCLRGEGRGQGPGEQCRDRGGSENGSVLACVPALLPKLIGYAVRALVVMFLSLLMFDPVAQLVEQRTFNP